MLLLDPLTDESQEAVAGALGAIPGIGSGWWDRWPDIEATDIDTDHQGREEAAAADRMASLQRMAAATGGEVGA